MRIFAIFMCAMMIGAAPGAQTTPATAPTMPTTQSSWIETEAAMRDQHLLNYAAHFLDSDVQDAQEFAMEFNVLCERGMEHEALFGSDKPPAMIDLGPGVKLRMIDVQRLVRINKTVDGLKKLGEDDIMYLSYINNLAFAYMENEDYGDASVAEHWFTELRRGLDLAFHGEPNPRYAYYYNGLGICAFIEGQPARAAPLFAQGMTQIEQTLGKDDSSYGALLNFEAKSQLQIGNAPAAKQLLNEEIERLGDPSTRKDLDPDDVRRRQQVISALLQTSAIIANQEGDNDKAVALMQEAMKHTEASRNPDITQDDAYLKMRSMIQKTQGDLAFLGTQPPTQQRLDEIEQGLIQALDTYKDSLYGSDHPNTAEAEDTLAHFLLRRAELEVSPSKKDDDINRAKGFMDDVRKIRQRAQNGSDDYSRMGGLMGACSDAIWSRAYAEAIDDAGKALKLAESLQGADGEATADPLDCLGYLEDAVGDAIAGREYLRRLLANSRSRLEVSFAAMSEDQQINAIRAARSNLDDYLSVCVHGGQLDAAAYDQLLAWKGSVFVHQKQIRQVLQSGNPHVVELFHEMERDAANLKELIVDRNLHPEGNDKRDKLIIQTQSHAQQIQAQLADLVQSLAGTKQQVRCADLQSLLPDGIALVDLIEYKYFALPKGNDTLVEPRKSFVAFVIRRDSVRGYALGPSKEIEDAWIAWHGSGANPAFGVKEGVALRKLIWSPLEGSLGGVKLAMISPDGVLGSVPFAALPANDDGTGYLIQKLALATLPVPQLLPRLLRDKDNGNVTVNPGGLLVVGDVDYNHAAGAASSVAGGPSREGAMASDFPDQTELLSRYRSGEIGRLWPLPSAAREIREICETFQRCMAGAKPAQLTGSLATVNALREALPGKSIIHIATHAFFAPTGITSAIHSGGSGPQSPLGQFTGPTGQFISSAGADPGLLSGFYLAGANRLASGKEGANSDTGILTALEISQLDLSACQLLVLSGCDTGLGRSAGGEGMLGLQRACQLAGARTIVASLWRVDDEKTRELMNIFYSQLLLHHRQPICAMRDAQLAILNQRADAGSWEQSASGPVLWAPWILSGDPGDLRQILAELSSPEPKIELAPPTAPPASNRRTFAAELLLAGCSAAAVILMTILIRRRKSWR